MSDKTSQVRTLKRMLACVGIVLAVGSIMATLLILFGDTQIGEPSVTARDIPALALIVVLAVGTIGPGFYLFHLAERYDEEFDVDEADSEPRRWSFTGASLALLGFNIMFMWPDDWKPIPDAFNAWWTGVSALAVAGTVAVIGVLAWRRLQEIKDA
ncbi:MAG: hypothetical protein GX678_03095 [Actinomycetales bacterium]|nr:hypothetical protein [Actinomycetales bacterium]